MPTKTPHEPPLNAEFGPAMMALPSDRHRAFVIAMCEQPVVNYTAAATKAGFGSTPGSSGVIGHRLAHDDRIQAAFVEEGQRRMKAMVPLAQGALRLMLENSAMPVKERLAVIKTILDRGGLPATTEHSVKTERVQSEAEKVQEVIAIAAALGLDPKSLLGRAGYTVEGKPLVIEHHDGKEYVVHDVTDIEEDWG